MRRKFYTRLIVGILSISLCGSLGLMAQTDSAYAAVPAKPQKVVMKKANVGLTTITLKWKKVKGADGYQIYRYNSNKGKYRRIMTIEDPAVLKYKDINLNRGTYYSYKIRAFKNYKQYYSKKKHRWVSSKLKASPNARTRIAKRTGPFSQVKKVRTKYLKKPVISASSRGYYRNDVYWGVDTDADFFEITEYDASGKVLATNNEVAGRTCTHFYNRSSKTVYYYTVRAALKADGVTHYSDYSDKKSCTPKKTTIGEAKSGENGVKGNKPGDQKGGGEIATDSWSYSSKSGAYNHWTYVLRFKDPVKATAAAAAMKAACDNNNIGYDQNPDNGRAELYKYAKAVGWRLDKVKTKCETSCSPLVGVCVNASGIFPSFDGSKAPGSTSMKEFVNPLINTGQFVVFTDKNHTTKQIYLDRGDILVSPGHHTCMVL